MIKSKVTYIAMTQIVQEENMSNTKFNNKIKNTINEYIDKGGIITQFDSSYNGKLWVVNITVVLPEEKENKIL